MISIDGLKISGELCLVRLRTGSPGSGLLPAFCGLLAGSRINMPFLSAESRDGGIQAVCCVDAAHRTSVERLLRTEPALQARAELTEGVGLLTLFPHRSRLTLVGRSLRALTQAGLRVFAMASSIGALTYVLDDDRLDEAAAVMRTWFELAANHAPFRAEFTVAQSTLRRPG